MKGECVIITGSSGLIGSAFIDRIGERFQEFGFDRQGPPKGKRGWFLIMTHEAARATLPSWPAS
jgi:nucleoside-diphosphate-sugar epimerase